MKIKRKTKVMKKSPNFLLLIKNLRKTNNFILFLKGKVSVFFPLKVKEKSLDSPEFGDRLYYNALCSIEKRKSRISFEILNFLIIFL